MLVSGYYIDNDFLSFSFIPPFLPPSLLPTLPSFLYDILRRQGIMEAETLVQTDGSKYWYNPFILPKLSFLKIVMRNPPSPEPPFPSHNCFRIFQVILGIYLNISNIMLVLLLLEFSELSC